MRQLLTRSADLGSRRYGTSPVVTSPSRRTRLLTIGQRCCCVLPTPRVRDQLSRIAADGSVKLPVRIVPPLIAERADGLTPVGCATAIAAWILHLRGHGAPVKDPGADRARTAAEAADDPTAVSGVLETLHSGLGDDSTLVRMIIEQMGALTAIPPAS
jgi:mannitol-1-phosphate/altronate dehydrogenase